MTYTNLYPKLLECRSSKQLELSKTIRERNNRTLLQEKNLKERLQEYTPKGIRSTRISSKVDVFLLKAASPK